MRGVIVFPGDPSVLVSAPHGHDYHTAEIVHEICQITGYAGVAIPHVEDRQLGLRVNVNRPTEGAGLTHDEETRTDLAQRTYLEYLRIIWKICGPQSPKLYVEVHGNETQSRVEVACIRVPMDARAAAKDAMGEMPGGIPFVEGIDRIVLDADQSRQSGILRFIPMAVHIELCELARELPEDRAKSAAAIARGIDALLDTLSPPPLQIAVGA